MKNHVTELIRLAVILVLVVSCIPFKPRAAEVDRSLAVVDKKISVYRQMVLMAIKEVEDACQ